jgi:hypothetical protein
MAEESEVPSTHIWQKLVLLLLPVSLILLIFPGSITQDGPAHLASGKIANELLAGKPVVSSVYQLVAKPLPNWAGQASAMLALRIFPEQVANCLLNLMGLWLPALGLLWLVQSVDSKSTCEGWSKPLWVSLSAMNVVWLFGFTSFLIGLAVGWVMIGLVWRAFDRKSLFLLIIATIGWCLLFLSHLVAYALAGIIFGVLWVCRFLPTDRRMGLKLAATTIPSLLLVVNYRRMTQQSRLELIWEHLEWSRPLSPGNWAKQAGWIDPVSLASKRWVPVLDIETGWAILLQPVFWLVIAASLIFVNMLRELVLGRKRDRAALFFAWLAVSLIGIFGPDTLGRDQGHYLPQRVCLAAMGMFCLNWPKDVPAMVPKLLGTGWILQVIYCTVFITESSAMAAEIRQIRAGLSGGSRVVALIDAAPWPFRANPRLHRDAIVVFAAEDIASWNLYEAGHAYFPLQFLKHPQGLEPARLEAISLARDENRETDRELEIGKVLESAKTEVDVIIVLAEPDSKFLSVVKNQFQMHETEKNGINLIITDQ